MSIPVKTREEREAQHQVNITARLDSCGRDFAAGDRLALMEAIFWCSDERPLPTWAANAFAESFYRVQRFESSSWDEVFGKPFPNRKMDALRLERRLWADVWFYVHALRRKRPKPPDIYQIVADKYGISKGSCKRLFLKIDSIPRPRGAAD